MAKKITAQEDSLFDVAEYPYEDDANALDQIWKLLDGTEWDNDTIELVAEIVERTGRRIGPPDADA